MADTSVQPSLPDVVRISPSDVRDAVRAGLADFQKAPGLSLFFGALFSAIGLAITLLLVQRGLSFWVLPLAAGFPLLGPFAAVGLYEISRRIEAGEALEARPILLAGLKSGDGQLPPFAVLAVFFFFA
ncbi:MAG: DUF2189 domain-containing protein, partial [Pseudomonadota bacterium]